MDDVAERLRDTAVYEYDKRAAEYSPWKWQHVVAIIVFVVVFAAWRFLYDGYQRLLRCGKEVTTTNGGVTTMAKYTLDSELVKRNNKASAIDFASFLLSLGIITAGTLDGVDVEETGKYFYTYFTYQARGSPPTGALARPSLKKMLVWGSAHKRPTLADLLDASRTRAPHRRSASRCSSSRARSTTRSCCAPSRTR